MTKNKAGFGAYPVALFYVLLPIAAVGGGLALAALQGVLGALAAPFRHLWPRTWLTRAFFLFLLSFVAWAALSSLWSPYPDHIQALKTPAGFLCGLLFAVGAAATPGNRNVTRIVGACAIAILAIMLCVEAFGNLPLNRITQPDVEYGLLARNPMRGVAVAVCLVWPCLAALAGGGALERLGWRFILIGAGIAAFQFGSEANAAAFCIGLLAYAAGFLSPRVVVIGLCFIVAAWLLAAPWVIPSIPLDPSILERVPDSWLHRIHMWRFASERIQDAPLIGWGLDAARTFQERVQFRGWDLRLISQHPHNFSLHIWLETGAVGAILAAISLVLGGVLAARAIGHDRLVAAGACGVIAAFSFIANVSFGAWQEWWVATGFAAAALIAASVRVTASEAEDEDD